MVISIEEAKSLVSFPDGWSDEKIKMKLLAVEQTIRSYTNNNFQIRGIRATGDIVDGEIHFANGCPFHYGDTVQISASHYNDGLVNVETADGQTCTVSENLRDENIVMCTKVEYPADVVACAVNMLEWEANNRDKVGIQSETLSRHSVTYFNMGAADQVMGYPASLLGCLKPYRKARC